MNQEARRVVNDSTPELTLVEGDFEQEKSDDESRMMTEEEINTVCDMTNLDSITPFEDLGNNISIDYAKKLIFIARELSVRNVSGELPYKGENFMYARNIEICTELKVSVYKFLDFFSKAQDTDSVKKFCSENSQLLADIDKFYQIESKKADWLEKEYYPEIFGRALQTARSEVMRYFIEYAHMSENDVFIKDASTVDIKLIDLLRYNQDLDESLTGSAGNYNWRGIDIRVTDMASKIHDEWSIYLVAIHELVHYLSYQNHERIGLKELGTDSGKEANEAVTEFITQAVALKHVKNGDYPGLFKEDPYLDISKSPYAGYTIPMKTIFSKVPYELFIEAFFSHQGFTKLEKEFDKVTGKSGSLQAYFKTLHDLYKKRQ